MKIQQVRIQPLRTPKKSPSSPKPVECSSQEAEEATPSKADQSPDAASAGGDATPGSGCRHSGRKKSFTSRFGIDDVPMLAMISPKSRLKLPPSVRNSPAAAEAEAAEAVSTSSTSHQVATPSPKNKKNRLRSATAKRKLSLAKSPGGRKVTNKRVRMTVADDRDTDMMENLAGRSSSGSQDDSSLSSPDRLQEEAGPPAAASSSSPEKVWSVSEVCESPKGEITMKINRKKRKKPNQLANLGAFHQQRLSRRMSQEMGMSPNKLRTVMIASPSPTRKGKKQVRKYCTCKICSYRKLSFQSASSTEKENSSGPVRPTTFSPLTSRGLYDLTTSPLLDKKQKNNKESNTSFGGERKRGRRVNKKLLYAE